MQIVTMAGLTSGGMSNDMLDYMQTKAYWQAEGVAMTAEAMQTELRPLTAKQIAALTKDLTSNDEAKRKAAASRLTTAGKGAIAQLEKAAAAAQGDPEKAGVIQQLIGSLYEAPQAGGARRLMAIRTLGELKARSALPALKGLLKSRVLFEADYAAEAIAAIEGKAYTRPMPTAKTLEGDIWRLPAGCGIVVRQTMSGGGPVDLAKIIKNAGQVPGGMTPEKMLEQATKYLTKGVGITGNIRVEAVTVGVSANVGNTIGYAAIIVRGKYDAKIISALIRDQGDAKSETIDGIDVLRPDDEIALILPNNSLLIMCSGSNRGELPVAEMVQAVKTGVGGLKPTSELGKLIKTIDTTKGMWAAATITDSYKQGGPVFAAFKTMTLVSKPAKDVQAYTLTARGTDAEVVAAAVKEFTGHVETGKAELEQMMQQQAMFAQMMKPMLDFLKTVKTSTDGATAIVTARLDGSGLMSILPMYLAQFSMMESDEVVNPPDVEDGIIPPDVPIDRD